jgi:hypothetical protein
MLSEKPLAALEAQKSGNNAPYSGKPLAQS